jgi:hypothetical protein
MISPGKVFSQPGGFMNIRTLIAGIGTAAVVVSGGLVLTGATASTASALSNPHAPRAKTSTHEPKAKVNPKARVEAKSSSAHKAKTKSRAHTLTLTAVATKTIGYGQAYITEASSDYNTKGRLVGFDALHFTENKSKRLVTVDGSFDLEDGIIYTTFTTSTSSVNAAGEVTGGTGAYVHAAGTITALTKSSSKTVVTIVYTAK